MREGLGIRSIQKKPLRWSTFSFFVEMACLLVYYLDGWISSWRKRPRRVLDYDRHDGSSLLLPEPSPYLWVFPAVLDFGASMMLLYALVLESASSVQILRTFSVILCAILSVSYLRRDLRVFHWLGICVMTLGLLLTGWDSIFSSTAAENDVSAGTRWLGVGLILCSTGLTVFQLVFEERLVSNYRCSPFQGVGWIGIWETVIVLFASLCAHIANYERLDVVWWQIARQPRLQLGLIGFAVSTAIFTACGLAVTKMGAALLTTTVTAMRQVPIWALELCLGWIRFGWTGFFGMLLTCLGFILYNHLVPARCCAGYERIAMKEVRIRCSCHDDLSEDEEEDDGDVFEQDLEDPSPFDLGGENSEEIRNGSHRPSGRTSHRPVNESTPPHAQQEDSRLVSTVQHTAATTENHGLPPPERVWKTAVITTKRKDSLTNPPLHTDSGSCAWIYVRRSEEWILTSDTGPANHLTARTTPAGS